MIKSCIYIVSVKHFKNGEAKEVKDRIYAENMAEMHMTQCFRESAFLAFLTQEIDC